MPCGCGKKKATPASAKSPSAVRRQVKGNPQGLYWQGKGSKNAEA